MENVKPKPVPPKNVKQMVKEYECLIIPPPEQFRDEYRLIPKPRTDRPPQIRENQNARRPRKKITTTTTKKEHEETQLYPLYNSGTTNQFKNQIP